MALPVEVAMGRHISKQVLTILTFATSCFATYRAAQWPEGSVCHAVPCCAMLCPSSAETGETWWNTDLGERVQYLLAFHFHLGGGFPLKTRFDKTILSRLAPAQTLAKPRVADEFLTSREYDPYLVVLTCLICSQTDCQICRTMRTSPFFMLELQTLSGLRGIIGIYILRNIIYYMINWEPKRQKKKSQGWPSWAWLHCGLVEVLPGAEAETLSTGPGGGLVSGARSPGMPWLCGKMSIQCIIW